MFFVYRLAWDYQYISVWVINAEEYEVFMVSDKEQLQPVCTHLDIGVSVTPHVYNGNNLCSTK